MKKGFYPHLAFDGIRKNKRLYLPYILTQIGMIMMYYIVIFLRYGKSLEGTFGDKTVNVVLMFGGWVIAIFACIFLFYTNSFLIRRRKKEFGLYNILGMDKKNISILLFWESLITSAISLFCGLVLGVALSKLAELGLIKVMNRAEVSYSFYVSPTAILLTAGVFSVIFLLLFLNSVRQIMSADAVTLLRSESLGEKPPKANPLLGVIGVLLLLGAYTTAVVVEEPQTAVSVFFIAVIMVIVGTYLLMIFGSVLLCRFLQKRKNYYYQPNHFVSVSSMTYRMKRNGAGLASVCVLATMVLVMISSTACLLFSTENSISIRYPRDIALSTGFTSLDEIDDDNLKKVAADIDSLAASHNANASNIVAYRSVVTVGTILDGGKLTPDGTPVDVGIKSGAHTCFDIVPIEDYNAVMGANEALAPDEVIVYGYKMKYKYDTVTLGDGKTYKVKKTVDNYLIDGDTSVNIAPSMFIFVPDLKEAVKGFAKDAVKDGLSTVNYKYFRFFDTDLDIEGERALCNEYIDTTRQLFGNKNSAYKNLLTLSIESRNVGREDYYSSFGALFYLGIMLSVVFIFAAVLIIYYKQVSEGYEDQSRFEIMQKVGMTKKEIRKSINSQLLTVFFLPLAGAGLHMIFASVIIRRILFSFNFNFSALFFVTTAICFVAFALFYTLIYRVTSNAYYKIVSGAKERE